MTTPPSADPTFTRSRHNTRTRLLDAAAIVIVEQGLAGASVDDLASAAGFTRGAFYSNFSSKEELLAELFRRESDQLIAVATQALAELPAQMTLEHIGSLFAALHPYSAHYSIIQHEYLLMVGRNPEHTREPGQVDRFEELIHTIIEEVLHRLRRRPLIDLDILVHVIAATYIASLMTLALALKFGDATPVRTLTTLVEHLSEPI